jgi:protein gp37
MATSSIEWTEKAWNPTVGCTKISAGCKHCYAETMHARLTRMGQKKYAEPFRVVKPWQDDLAMPLRWRKPARIFVNSMSDLFHEDVPDEYIDKVFGVMAACRYIGRDAMPGHTFQVLTKRAERMERYLTTDRRQAWARAAVYYGGGIDPDGIHDQIVFGSQALPNVWLGVSVENQEQADARIPHLLRTPAAVRFLSCEPLLERVELGGFLAPAAIAHAIDHHHRTGHDCGGGGDGAYCDVCGAEWTDGKGGIDWVVVGAESGYGARPMNEDWIRSLRDQCSAAGVPFFYKQRLDERGRKVSLPMLDGRQWAEFPR